MNFLKNTEETLKDYKIRLFRNKETYGLTNKDIAKLINQADNSNKDESTYRKWYSAYQEGFDDGLEKANSKNSILQSKIELEIEKKKIQTEKIEINKWLREQARTELLYEKLANSMKECLKNEYIIRPKECNNNPNKNAVLFLSDQHYGVDFTIYGLNNEIINKYSPEIFEERMEIILNDIIIQIKKYNIEKLYIVCLGDTLDGFLRNSQLAKLRWGVTDCAIKYGLYMFKWLEQLSKYVDIEFYNTSGNHTELRLLDGKKGEHEHENLDKVIMAIIELGVELTKNERIKIVSNKTGYVYLKLPCGYSIFGFHGEVKNLENALKDFREIYNVEIDYIAAGHLHHNNFTNCGRRKGTIRVGSIIGVDDFSINKVRRSADATANFVIFEQDKGLVDSHTIILN